MLRPANAAVRRRAYAARMMGLPLILILTGLTLFVAGDLLWLMRNTFRRPMDIRVTGGLVAAGVLIMGAGLLVFALEG